MAALALLCVAPVSGVRAQAGAAAAPVKIAVMNVRNAIVATAEGKQAQAQLQSQFAPKQNELQNMQKQIEDLQRRLSEGARTLSDEEKAKMQREGELLTRRLQRNNDDLNEELNAAQSEIVDSIGRKMLEVLDRYSRENGFTVVLDTSAQGSPVVYGSSQSDITPEDRPALRPGLSGQGWSARGFDSSSKAGNTGSCSREETDSVRNSRRKFRFRPGASSRGPRRFVPPSFIQMSRLFFSEGSAACFWRNG